ncbi:Armadillo-type fold [Pseudocohnilembus persalinus]|uniref:Armadillo-type fold n=1 Tax=Pseudocohnilembus persalinus TaxID=266149 RepID=A0A0V0R1E3_PSEPJ|nr:Armadillo-type fold [Pseudocohnilembus persalinus]|eukprot:KRX08173.1 Armadillo-type fold [Pseudocohnilembus persalinus]
MSQVKNNSIGGLIREFLELNKEGISQEIVVKMMKQKNFQKQSKIQLLRFLPENMIRKFTGTLLQWVQLDKASQTEIVDFLLDFDFQTIFGKIQEGEFYIHLSNKAQIMVLRHIRQNLCFWRKNRVENLSQQQYFDLFFFVCRQIRSLNFQVRLSACQTLIDFPLFNEDIILSIIQKEQLGEGKGGRKREEIKSSDIEIFTDKIEDNFITGTIIHILEDEFHDIRISGIKIIENFAVQSEIFRKESRDILIHLFNDENDKVRIQSLQSIKSIFKSIQMKKSEVQQLVFNLKENVFELRINIYELIENMVFGSSERNNHDLVRENLEKILGVQDSKYTNVPFWHQKVHILRMIMLYNAFLGELNSEKLPFYFQNHIVLIKEQFGEYFPENINLLQNKIIVQKSEKKKLNKLLKLFDFLFGISEVSFQNKNLQFGFQIVNQQLENIYKETQLQDQEKVLIKLVQKSFQNGDENENLSSNLQYFVHKLSTIIRIFYNFGQNIAQNENFDWVQSEYMSLNQKLRKLFQKIQKLKTRFYIENGSIFQEILDKVQFQSILVSLLLFFDSESLNETIEFKKIQNICNLVISLVKTSNSKYLQEIKNDVNFMKIKDICQEIAFNFSYLKRPKDRKNFALNYYSKLKRFLQNQEQLRQNQNFEVLREQIPKMRLFFLNSPKQGQILEIRSKYQAQIDVDLSIYNLDQQNLKEQLAILIQYGNGEQELFKLEKKEFILKEKSNQEFELTTKLFLRQFQSSRQTEIQISIIDINSQYFGDFQQVDLTQNLPEIYRVKNKVQSCRKQFKISFLNNSNENNNRENFDLSGFQNQVAKKFAFTKLSRQYRVVMKPKLHIQ